MVYLMLSRHLPFDSNDDKEIGRKTIYQQITFTHSVWENVSADAKDLIFSKYCIFILAIMNFLCRVIDKEQG